MRHSQEEHIIPFSVDEAFSTHPPSETHRQTTISSHYGPDGNMSKIRLPVNSERPQNTIEVGRSGQQGERAKSATGNTSARHKDPSRPKEKNPCIRCQQGSTGVSLHYPMEDLYLLNEAYSVDGRIRANLARTARHHLELFLGECLVYRHSLWTSLN